MAKQVHWMLAFTKSFFFFQSCTHWHTCPPTWQAFFKYFYPPMSDDVTYNGYIGVHQLPAVLDLQVTSCYHSYALLDHSYVHQKPFLKTSSSTQRDSWRNWILLSTTLLVITTFPHTFLSSFRSSTLHKQVELVLIFIHTNGKEFSNTNFEKTFRLNAFSQHFNWMLSVFIRAKVPFSWNVGNVSDLKVSIRVRAGAN